MKYIIATSLLPEQAWPQHLYQKCSHQYEDKLCNELLQYPVRILYLLQHRNSKALGVLGIHFWANRMDVDLGRVRYILVQYRTMVFRLCIYWIIILKRMIILWIDYNGFYFSAWITANQLWHFLPFHSFITALPMVGLRWFLVILVSLTKNQFVIS